ncbi:MAG: thiamine diphosphokinase [Balneola sp.]|nr:MAG: thiamine diphosphokinase [Balneola sp.]
MHALIIAGGVPPTKKLIEKEIEKADLTIGADSGGHTFLGYGFTPDIVIGDMDSFVYTRHKGVNILEDPDQESNDLEKALSYALTKGAKTCVILGALGKRIDHVMKNFSVLQQFQPRFDSILFRDDYGDTFLVTSPYKIGLPVGSIISFFPVRNPVEAFTSSGVLYPLTNSILEMGGQDGTSNEITSADAELRFKEGYLGVFVGNGSKMK